MCFLGSFANLFYLCTMKQIRVNRNPLWVAVCKIGFVHCFVVSLLLFFHLGVAAQRSEILSPRIASLQVVAGDNWQSMPVVELNGQSILIAFDDLTHEYHRYTYKIEHCDADWKV